MSAQRGQKRRRCFSQYARKASKDTGWFLLEKSDEICYDWKNVKTGRRDESLFKNRRNAGLGQIFPSGKAIGRRNPDGIRYPKTAF